MEVLVGGEGDQGPKCDAHRVEDLGCRVHPHLGGSVIRDNNISLQDISFTAADLGLEHLLPLGGEEVLEAGVCAGQRAGADGEDEEQHQRQRGGHIHHLASHLHTAGAVTDYPGDEEIGRSSPLPDGEVDHHPGDDEGAEELPAEAAHVLDTLGHLEDAAVVELLRAGVRVVLGQARVGGGQVSVHDGAALGSGGGGLLHCYWRH